MVWAAMSYWWKGVTEPCMLSLHTVIHFAIQALTLPVANNTYFQVRATAGEQVTPGDVNPATVFC